MLLATSAWCDRRCVFWVTITNTSGRKRFLSLLIYRTRHHDHRCVFVWFSKTLSYWPPELLRLCVWVSLSWPRVFFCLVIERHRIAAGIVRETVAFPDRSYAPDI
jgi:hypothetical protein